MKQWLAGIALGCVASVGVGENWPGWRGPTGNGISLEKNVPTEWSAEKGVAWRVKLPGWGASTPVIWDQHIFLTSPKDGKVFGLAFDTSGKQLWSHQLGTSNKEVRGGEGNMACISPVTDGKHVWLMDASGVIVCFDFAGKEVWRKDLQKEYGKYQIAFNLVSTPVLHGNNLYFHCLHDGESYVLALNKMNGEKSWYTARSSKAIAECKHGYTSPIIYTDTKNQSVLISHGSDDTIAYDLEKGTELWRCGGLQTDPYHKTLRFVATPVAVPGMIVVPSAKNEGFQAIDPTDARGLISGSKHIRWKVAKGTPDVSAPLVVDGLVYITREKNGMVAAYDARTGEKKYQSRIHTGLYRASPVYADGHVYHTCRDGVVTVIKTGSKLTVVSENTLNGEPMTASPAISNGVLYLRTHKALYAVGSRK